MADAAMQTQQTAAESSRSALQQTQKALQPPVLQKLLAQAHECGNALSLYLRQGRSLTAGIGGLRHKRSFGQGEQFWQFRPYQSGDASTAVDWRRSARESQLYVREKQQQASKTFCLIADLTPSMLYQSKTACCSKEERALLLLFVLADFFVKNGEKITIPSLLPPSAGHNAAETVAAALAADATYPQRTGLRADYAAVPHFAHCIIISDFLDKTEDWHKIFALLAEKQVQIDSISISDPAEAEFPFHGDMLFRDPESDSEHFFGQAQNGAEAYRQIYRRHYDALRQCVTGFGGSVFADTTHIPLLQRIDALAQFIQNFYEERQN